MMEVETDHGNKQFVHQTLAETGGLMGTFGVENQNTCTDPGFEIMKKTPLLRYNEVVLVMAVMLV